MSHNDRYAQAKKVTLIGALVNALLGIIKVVGGIVCHSHALTADGIHSFADLLTDMMVLFASKYGSQAADDSHPYGHGRIETAATMLLSLFLIIAGLAIAWDALMDIIAQTHDASAWFALPIAALSILANESLFHYTRYVGKSINSSLIMANAWHHRSDAASSAVVMIGLAGSLLGFEFLDAVAAIVVAMMIVKMGCSYGWTSVQELVDTAVDDDTLNKIEALICGVDGVVRIHQLRSRMMAGDILIDVHILVSPNISVSEGHYIAQHVHQRLITTLDRVKDVTVHVDPEDDEVCCPSMHLPNRTYLNTQFFSKWKQDYPEICDCILHYLDGSLRLDVVLDKTFSEWDRLEARILADTQQDVLFKKVCLLQRKKGREWTSS